LSTTADSDPNDAGRSPLGDSRGVAVGIVASRKVGNAVARNRAKRVLRAALAPLRPHLKAYTRLVLVARRSMIEDGVGAATVEAELAKILEDLGLMQKEGS
jgi:ribonuclease P protein component